MEKKINNFYEKYRERRPKVNPSIIKQLARLFVENHPEGDYYQFEEWADDAIKNGF